MLESLFNKVACLQRYFKETSTQVFFCEICEIFKNTYFEQHLRTFASGLIMLYFISMGIPLWCAYATNHCSQFFYFVYKDMLLEPCAMLLSRDKLEAFTLIF